MPRFQATHQKLFRFGIPQSPNRQTRRRRPRSARFDLPEGSTCEDFAQFCHDPEVLPTRFVVFFGTNGGCWQPGPVVAVAELPVGDQDGDREISDLAQQTVDGSSETAHIDSH